MPEVNYSIDEMFKEIQLEIDNLSVLNIVLLGKTGTGKSTLVNNLFRDNLADTGVGRPITQTVLCYEKPPIPLRIFDTRGFELDSKAQNEVAEAVHSLIKKGVEARDINKNIHCAIYCINASLNRIESEEIEWIREFTRSSSIYEVPVIVVLTQAVAKNRAAELKGILEAQQLNIQGIVPLLAEDYPVDDDFIVKAYGLDRLIKLMSKVLPERLGITLQNVQIASLQEKRRESLEAVHKFSTAAGIAAASPIPFSDAALLVPIQIAMVARITAVFGIELSKSVITGLVSSTIGSAGATFVGRSFVSGVLKLIPGVGTVTGGAISAATAVALTEALGRAYTELMAMIFRGEISKSDINSDVFLNLLRDYMKAVKRD